MAASYRKAIQWIALNDEPTLDDRNFDDIACQISVLLVADLWRKHPGIVAAAVIKERARA